jgi:hypothetical protein
VTQLGALVRFCEPLSADDLLAALGSALDGSELNVSPVDPERLRRFARRWLATKSGNLRERVRRTETYRIWAATAGPEQVMEADVVAVALAQDGFRDEIAAPAAVAIQRIEIARAKDYDVAVSCAERESDYVQSVVAAARARDLRVFYEKEMTYEWWGRNFITEGRRIYGRRARYFVPFISAVYLREARPRDAFESAVSAAVARRDDYILPVLVGDVRVAPELLDPAIGYLRSEDHSPAELAAKLAERVTSPTARTTGARDFGAVAHDLAASP